MMRALYTSASGMIGQQYQVDTIANNISNVNTTAYKKMRVAFEDLLYQTDRASASPSTEETVRPLATQVGNGVRVVATQRLLGQGSLEQTDNLSDLAIVGSGYFQVQLANGKLAYTRDGSFQIDANAQLVNNNGYRLSPDIILPDNFVQDSLVITGEGRVLVTTPIDDNPVQVGQIRLFNFPNPEGLQAMGDNLFSETAASGPNDFDFPGQRGLGIVKQKFLESSNVSIAKELINMIVAQRAYELNSKAVQTSDSMLEVAVNLKRT